MSVETPVRPARTYAFSVWLFMRGLGVVYFIAFASAWVQLLGLIGPHGILPADEYLYSLRAFHGNEAYFKLPTLAWFGSSDATLNGFCLVGMAASVALTLGFIERFMLIICWELYLSIMNAGQDFFSFQWDALLIETSIVAFFNASWRLWAPKPSHEPHRIARSLLYMVLFKVIFLSGVVKLKSGDANWFNGTAMNYHFQTQPLPTSLAWTMHHLPDWALKVISYGTIILELAAPLIMICPGVPRLIAAFWMIGLQVAIALTGNYGFFSILTALLCIPLIEERFWLRITPAKFKERFQSWITLSGKTIKPKRWTLMAPFTVWLLLLGSLMHDHKSAWPQPFQSVMELMHATNSFNSYGAFAIMTTQRYEFVLEGSADGKNWREYPFRWKPGDVNQFPRVNTPHQPRLDWQMWFLDFDPNHYADNDWLKGLEKRVLDGTPEVLSLFASNPFPDKPPSVLRWKVYEYEFTTREEYEKTGACWKRTFKKQFGPPVRKDLMNNLFKNLADFDRIALVVLQ